jgi:uncharacterized protein (DUF4415 family)
MPAGRKPTEPRSTGTDWERVRREAAADAPVAYDPAGDADTEPYDPNDEAAVAAHWAAADIRRGPGRPRKAVERPTLNMRIDADVLAAFKATGPGWQTRINALLREAVESGRLKP